MIGLGWGLLALGIAGLFLPVLQGILFIALGLLVLSREYAWARQAMAALERRFPGLREKCSRFPRIFHRAAHSPPPPRNL